MPDVVSLSENEIRKIVSDQIQEQLTVLEARIVNANRTALTEALSTIPTEDVVSRMIDSKLSDTRREFQASINSIDSHLRSAESRLTDSSRHMGDVTQKLESLLPKLQTTVEKIQLSVETQEKKLNSAVEDVQTLKDQSSVDRQALAHTKDQLDDLRADIHGDATKPDVPSLFHMVREMNKSVTALDTRLIRYDNIYNMANKVWASKLGKAVITVMLTTFATDVVYQAIRILQTLVTGKGTP